jgi:hypothetical protein
MTFLNIGDHSSKVIKCHEKSSKVIFRFQSERAAPNRTNPNRTTFSSNGPVQFASVPNGSVGFHRSRGYMTEFHKPPQSCHKPTQGNTSHYKAPTKIAIQALFTSLRVITENLNEVPSCSPAVARDELPWVSQTRTPPTLKAVPSAPQLQICD